MSDNDVQKTVDEVIYEPTFREWFSICWHLKIWGVIHLIILFIIGWIPAVQFGHALSSGGDIWYYIGKLFGALIVSFIINFIVLDLPISLIYACVKRSNNAKLVVDSNKINKEKKSQPDDDENKKELMEYMNSSSRFGGGNA